MPLGANGRNTHTHTDRPALPTNGAVLRQPPHHLHASFHDLSRVMIPSDSADCGRQFRLATPPRARPVGVLSLASIASTGTRTHSHVEIVLPASLRNRRKRDNHLACSAQDSDIHARTWPRLTELTSVRFAFGVVCSRTPFCVPARLFVMLHIVGNDYFASCTCRHG